MAYKISKQDGFFLAYHGATIWAPAVLSWFVEYQ